jgi:hypothetical protein
MKSLPRGLKPEMPARKELIVMSVWTAIALVFAAYQPVFSEPVILPPDVDLSAIRSIRCDDGSYGTGFVINNGVIATARHVTVDENDKPLTCWDRQSGSPLVTYHRDKAHDFALMSGYTGVYYPLKYDCKPYEKGLVQMYGHRPESFRQHNLTSTGSYTNKNFSVGGIGTMPGMRKLEGVALPGLSGGPGIQNGYVRGIVNVGERDRYGITRLVYSYELKDTVLCVKAPEGSTPSQSLETR